MQVKFSRQVSQQALFRVQPKLTMKHLSGSSPAPFVGHVGYPYLNVGVLSPVESTADASAYDAPRQWAAQNVQIPQVIDYRSSLINSRFKAHIKTPHKFL